MNGEMRKKVGFIVVAAMLFEMLLPGFYGYVYAEPGDYCSGTQVTVGSVSDLTEWYTFKDNHEIGTEITPNAGMPLYQKGDGSVYAESIMKIEAEPEWTAEAAAAGTLLYPKAGISVYFMDDHSGVSFNTLGIKYIRITSKSSGPVWLKIMNTLSEQATGAGSEPGIYVEESEDYETVLYDMTPEREFGCGFIGAGENNMINILDWVDKNEAPEGSDILKHITGLSWEVKDAKGGTGKISIKSVEFLDADQNPVELNTLPYFINVDKTKLSVPENATKAAAGKIQANDKEGNDYLFDIIGGTAQDLFNIGFTTGVVTMKDGVDYFDYERDKDKNLYIDVEVCDTKHLTARDSTRFNISIRDENEKPYFTGGTNELEIQENAEFTSSAATFSDYDTDKAHTEFRNNEVVALGGDTDLFEVLPDGRIKAKQVFDYETATRKTFELQLRVRDATKDGDGDYIFPELYDDRTFSITLKDVDETPAVSKKDDPGQVVEKAANTLNVKTIKKTYKIAFSKLKKKKQSIAANKLYRFTDKKNTKGAIRYALVSAKKGSKNYRKSFSVNKKNGKLTIKKGLAKGSYKITVKVSAAGDKSCKEAEKNVTFTVKVK